MDATKAAAAAKSADAVVLVVDNFRDGGGEGHDRYTIGLSSDQISLANAVIAANKKTVLITREPGRLHTTLLAALSLHTDRVVLQSTAG